MSAVQEKCRDKINKKAIYVPTPQNYIKQEVPGRINSPSFSA
jgi:hypothetical protein